MENKVIGIVGGMGPRAGTDLVNSIIANTSAATDQDHLSTILMSFPSQLKDRTQFLDGETTVNPGIAIAQVVDKLIQAGAEVIGMACNTAYAQPIYQVVCSSIPGEKSSVRLVHMPMETCTHIKNTYPVGTRVGLMCTNGTYRSGLYTSELKANGLDVVLPNDYVQKNIIHEMVYHPTFGIKAKPEGISPEVKALWHEVIYYFKCLQVDVVILACTEFSLAFKESQAGGIAIVDASKILAKALIREALALNACNSTLTAA